MNNKIKSIVVTYNDGHFDEFPESLLDKITQYQEENGFESTVTFFYELLRNWDKDMAVTSEREKSEEKEQVFIKQAKKEKEQSVKLANSVTKGQLSEKWAPYLGLLPYSLADCVKADDPLDWIAFPGLSELNITAMHLLELKTGVKSKSLSNPHEIEIARFIHSIGDERIKFKHFAMTEKDTCYQLILHPHMFDETSEPEYLATHKYLSLCKGYFDPVGHRHFHPFPESNV